LGEVTQKTRVNTENSEIFSVFSVFILSFLLFPFLIISEFEAQFQHAH
jgi:hypothetical protein